MTHGAAGWANRNFAKWIFKRETEYRQTTIKIKRYESNFVNILPTRNAITFGKSNPSIILQSGAKNFSRCLKFCLISAKQNGQPMHSQLALTEHVSLNLAPLILLDPVLSGCPLNPLPKCPDLHNNTNSELCTPAMPWDVPYQKWSEKVHSAPYIPSSKMDRQRVAV